ncbi:tetratricopeptide repeat protein [Flavobacterium undicola]|uniref:tetratricopeptide repeat protein n=1 Tax=Flavobacterium undicola TaxID=1932779 RepID=UPI00137907E0|nr:tetratricopeptide repeat protein [Flavobacterium undicola]MBA0882418.1 tetratricopeptide repeat protein [Flavobacterium undicola]
MKGKYVMLASALLLSVATFAQKNELKAAEKAVKKGDMAEVLTILKGAESVMANASAEEKAQYFFLKGNAHMDLVDKKIDKDANMALAAEAYKELIATEKTSGKLKYSAQAATSITMIKNLLINSGVEATKANNNLDGAKKLYEAYQLDKKDTINLYYAASTYVSAKDYDKAMELYSELKRLNYSGKATEYLATSKVNGQEVGFASVAERDRAVKLGTHEKPRTEEVPSKRGEIYKNMALILVDKGQIAEAKKAVADARTANPDDSSLMLTEANLYLQTKDFDRYKQIITEVLAKNPNDAGLVYNLGVISANANDNAEAEKYYKRAVEIKPDYTNAYINLAVLKLQNEKVLIEEMNKLGTSDKDMKRYDVLKKKREELFKSTLPYLKKAYELDPENMDVAKTLSGVYGALEMTEEKNALKAKMKK